MFGKDGVTVNVVTPGLTVTPAVKLTVTPAVKEHMPPELIEQQIKLRAIPARGEGRRSDRRDILSRVARLRFHHGADR